MRRPEWGPYRATASGQRPALLTPLTKGVYAGGFGATPCYSGKTGGFGAGEVARQRLVKHERPRRAARPLRQHRHTRGGTQLLKPLPR